MNLDKNNSRSNLVSSSCNLLYLYDCTTECTIFMDLLMFNAYTKPSKVLRCKLGCLISYLHNAFFAGYQITFVYFKFNLITFHLRVVFIFFMVHRYRWLQYFYTPAKTGRINMWSPMASIRAVGLSRALLFVIFIWNDQYHLARFKVKITVQGKI